MKIQSATFQVSAPDLKSCPAWAWPEFAFIGRSNVGKSSLLNMLAGESALAKVSATPGHTQLINFFLMNNTWSLVDLPGYGYAKTHQREERGKFEEMVGHYLAGRPNLVGVMVLIDSRHPPQAIDLEFVQWVMDSTAQVVLVFTKTDLVKPKEVQRNIALFQEKVAAWEKGALKVFTTSSKDRMGRRELMGFIEGALAEKGES